MVSFPLICDRCGSKRYHYGACTETPECLAIFDHIRNSEDLIDLARRINPKLPTRDELRGQIIHITLSKDVVSATAYPEPAKNPDQQQDQGSN